MKKFVDFVSRPKVIFTALGVFALVCVLSNTVFRQSYTYLTQTLHYSPDMVANLLNSIGEKGRTAHLFIFIADLVMILSYTVLLVGANYHIFRNWVKSCVLITLITFFPLLLTITQLSEIIILTAVITSYNHVNENMVYLSSMLTQIKYYLTTICFLLPIFGLCGKIVIRLLKSRYRSNEE